MLFLLLFTTLTTLSFTKYTYQEQDHIITLGGPTWWFASQEFPQGLLVYFYEPYSLPCRQFWPELHKATQILHNLESVIQIAKVDCYDEINFCKYLEMIDYPTIRLYRPGYPVYEYRGLRTAESLENWIRKTVDFEYLTVDNINSLFQNHSIALVYNELIYSVNATYAEFFYQIEIAKAGPFIKNLIGDNPAAIVTQRSHIVPIGPDMLAREVKAEVKRLLYVEKIAVPTITWENYIDIQKGKNYTYVIFFRSKGFDVRNEISMAFDEVAQESQKTEKLKFVYVNVKDDLIGFQLGSMFGISVDSESTIGIITRQDLIMKKYKIETSQQTVNSEYLRQFISDFNSGTLQRYLKSGDMNKKSQGYIKELVRKNYDQVTKDPKLHVFVMLYDSLCEYCVDLEAAWKALAYRLRYRNDIVVARVDMSENDFEEFESLEYPTLLFYPAGNKIEVIRYSNGTNINEFKRFLSEYVLDIEEHLEL